MVPDPYLRSRYCIPSRLSSQLLFPPDSPSVCRRQPWLIHTVFGSAASAPIQMKSLHLLGHTAQPLALAVLPPRSAPVPMGPFGACTVGVPVGTKPTCQSLGSAIGYSYCVSACSAPNKSRMAHRAFQSVGPRRENIVFQGLISLGGNSGCIIEIQVGH